MAIEAGFQCLYMTGAGVSMSRIGMADLGLATQTEMVDTAGMIANIDPKIPLIADAEYVPDVLDVASLFVLEGSFAIIANASLMLI